jgi:hypothetical protein
VTRCGCRRGASFEGCEAASWGRRATARNHFGGSGSGRRRKHGEPHGRQRDETSPQHPGGESRQGGERPRRRNRIGRMAPSDRRGSSDPREWTPGVSNDGEATSGRIPREEGEPSAVRALWRRGRSCRRHTEHHLDKVTGAPGRKTPRTRPVTGKVEGGAGKADDPLRQEPGRTNHFGGEEPQASESRPTSRELRIARSTRTDARETHLGHLPFNNTLSRGAL